MSMIGNYLRVTMRELDALRFEPAGIIAVLYPDGGHGDPEQGRCLDIDKSWHAIHFLLTGEPWDGALPLLNAVMGGTELGEEDVGYGPARYLLPAEVKAVAQALASLSGEALWQRFDAKAFARAEIYPQGWSEDGKHYVLGHYERLRAIFAEAAQADDAMLLYLS